MSSTHGGKLSRCEGTACQPIAERTILATGSRIRLDRGAIGRIALDDDTEVEARDAAEIALEQRGDERVVELARGTAVIRRREGAASDAPEVILRAAGRAIAISGPAVVEVRSATPGVTTALIERGAASLREANGARLLVTGDGARWRDGEAAAPYARWSAPIEDDETEATGSSTALVRGLGSMSARVPGTEEVVSGVRLAMHHVSAEVQDGFARTTVEEVFENETKRTLEGRFVFPLPPDASISRLALYVGEQLVEGEIVDKPLAQRVFRTIVDDTVRPRDPAILEMKAGSTVSLKVFPIPPMGKRRVLLAYDQILPERGDRARYVYPLSLGPDRATTIDDFAVSVTVKDSAAAVGNAACAGYEAAMRADEGGLIATYSAKRFAPASDFVLRYTRDEGKAASLSWSAGPKEVAAREAKETAAGYFALRFQADAPEGFVRRRIARPSRVFVVDASHSQSADTLDAAARTVGAALRSLDPQDRFAVLACDSACESFPEDGLARAGDEAIAAASSWIARRGPGGSSDLAGALIAGAERVAAEGGGQVVYLGDGVATSGELSPALIAARIGPAFQGLDAHFVGLGSSLDEAGLSAIAGAVAGTYERFATGDPVTARAQAIARTIDAPVIRDARLTVPEGAFDVLPAKLPRLRLGQEVRVLGRFRPASTKTEAEGQTRPASVREGEDDAPARGPLREVRLTGRVAGAPYEIARSLDWGRALASPSPAVHALWARAKIASLEVTGDPDAKKEIVRLSTVHHVLSRATALLVLENERMFVETGVRAAIDRVLAQEPPARDATRAVAQGPSLGAKGKSGGSSVAPKTDFGMLGLLGKEATASAPWGDSASASPSARGNMWGSSDSFGAGGLGLSGIGEGGGGRGEGIGLGSIGTVGHAAGTGTATGFGSGHGRLAGSHNATAPKLRSGAASVSGRVPPEVIQRVIRQAFGRFRLCYEKGLQKDPNLTGMVSIAFVIDHSGSVASASNAGSSLGDPAVVTCVVQAVSGLRFPEPEGGIVKVVYPISFAPATDASSTPGSSTSGSSTSGSSTSGSPPSSGSWQPPRGSSLSTSWAHPVSTAWPKWAPNPPPDSPVVVHRAPEESGALAEDKALAKLLAQAADATAPRSAHQSLVKKLLASGRFDDAFAAASRYVGLDPDHEVALELYAEAAAATGRPRIALLSVDAQVETDPTRASLHRRAAAAFEAVGDERRACAHFRAIASLPGADDAAAYHALRCRARLGDRTAVLAEARAIAKPGALVAKLITTLEGGSAPAFAPSAASGPFEARVVCRGEGAECPSPIVVGPTGTVISPWTPAAPCARDALALSSVASGTYRTLLTGEVPPGGVELTVRALGQSKTLTLQRAGVALATSITLPDPEAAFR